MQHCGVCIGRGNQVSVGWRLDFIDCGMGRERQPVGDAQRLRIGGCMEPQFPAICPQYPPQTDDQAHRNPQHGEGMKYGANVDHRLALVRP